MKPDRKVDDPAIIAMLANPVRMKVLRYLERETASPTSISKLLDIPLGTVSYHVRELRKFGLIKLVKEIPRRGAIEHLYCAEERVWFSDQAWGQLPAIVKQRALDSSLGILGEEVRRAMLAGGFDPEDIHATLHKVDVDDEGWRYFYDLLMDVFFAIKKYQAKIASERKCHDAHKRKASIALMLFEGSGEEASEIRSPSLAASNATQRGR